jgi:20S proteasome alpha/beta subunit
MLPRGSTSHVSSTGLSATRSYIHSPCTSRTSHSLSLSLTPAQVFPINNQLYVGLPGFATDTYTLREHLRFRVNMYRMKEEREITPKTFAHLLSSTLYEKR